MIKEILIKLNSELPATVKLVAVSKFHPFDSIAEAYEAGQRIFAESRPQELAAKVREQQENYPQMSDIQWHFIGHLQTNKLKMVLPYADLVQSVDSQRLLDAIQNWGAANDKVIKVLLEQHIASEESKQGFSREEIISILENAGEYTHIRFCGLMGMATFTDDEAVIKSDFAKITATMAFVRANFPGLADFKELSIGMSDDYPIAIAAGSTMVRIGTMIFGSRNY